MRVLNSMAMMFSVACLAAGCLAFSGCATQPEEMLAPHITQADTPRIDPPDSDEPVMSLDQVTEAYRSRLEALRAENAADPMELDAFGGWVNAPDRLKTVAPNGFFQVAKLDGAWWFITPDGNPFVSKGVTDVNWFGATLADDEFHDILVQKYGDKETWAAAAEKRLLEWGFNTVGPWSSVSMGDRFPHAFVILDMGGHAPRHPNALVTDYYAPAFAEHAAAIVEQRARPQVDNKHLIGYFLDNEVVWGADHFRTNETLIQLYMGFPPGAPGHDEAIRFLREASSSIACFNDTWKTNITDWTALETLSATALVPETDEAHAITEAFMLQVFHHYADISIDAVRALDPHRLLLGCRFHNYPGDALFEAAAQRFDVVSMAFYEARPPVKELDAIAGRADAPVLIGEWTFKSDDSGILNPFFGIYAPVVRTMQERCLAYDNYVETFMRRPYGIGYHWYKWMDNPALPERRATGDNCGLLNQEDEPYEVFVEFISEVNRRAERWHAQGSH